MVQKIIIFTTLILSLLSCDSPGEKPSQLTENEIKTLPIIGEKFFDEKQGDTVYHTIPHFHLTNQEGDNFCSDTLSEKPYVADFFFTHCPQMCPKMTSALKRVQAGIPKDDFNIISISVDPKRDTVERLQAYIEKSHIETENWQLLRGDKKTLDHIAYDGFFAGFGEDGGAPGGHFHSSYIYLIDGKGRIRGFYDGLDDNAVNQLTLDLQILIENE